MRIIKFLRYFYFYLEKRNSNKVPAKNVKWLSDYHWFCYLLMNFIALIYIILLVPSMIVGREKPTEIKTDESSQYTYVIFFAVIFFGIVYLIGKGSNLEARKKGLDLNRIDDKKMIKKFNNYMIFSWMLMFIIPIILGLIASYVDPL